MNLEASCPSDGMIGTMATYEPHVWRPLPIGRIEGETSPIQGGTPEGSAG